jgi:autotransporter translocation and assembly factor TamB
MSEMSKQARKHARREGASMTWLKRILIGGGAVLLLLVVILFIAGSFSTGNRSASQTVSMTVNDRTVTVGGHYKDMTQESLADGVKIVVDGHEITLAADELTVDGKTQMLEPGQDVDVQVDEKGGVSVKLVASDTGPAHAAQ